MLTANCITAHRGRRIVLHGVSMVLPTPGLVGVIGPNGAGKSTLLDVLNGYLGVTAGEIRYSGGPVAAPSCLRRRTARLDQRTLLPPELSARRYLHVMSDPGSASDIVRSLGRIGRAWVPLTVPIAEAARAINFDAIADQPLGELSGGQRRFVAALGALLSSRPIVLLDEPFAGLRNDAADALAALLIAQAQHKTILLCDHQLERVSRLCDPVWVLNNGRLVSTVTQHEYDPDRLLEYFLDG